MSLQFMKDIRSALANLDPDHVRSAAERPLRVALAGGSSDQLAAIEDYLVPVCVSREKRIEVAQSLFRHGDPGSPQDYDITLAVNGEPSGGDAFAFDFRDPQRTLREILAARQDLGLALARSFPPFRQPMVERIIHMVCRGERAVCRCHCAAQFRAQHFRVALGPRANSLPTPWF